MCDLILVCLFVLGAVIVWLLFGIRAEIRRLSFWSGPREERSSIPEDIMRERLARAKSNAALEDLRTKEEDDALESKRNRRGIRTPSKLGSM